MRSTLPAAIVVLLLAASLPTVRADGDGGCRDLALDEIVPGLSPSENEDGRPSTETDMCEGRRTPEQRQALSTCVRWGFGAEHEFMMLHHEDMSDTQDYDGIDDSLGGRLYISNTCTAVDQLRKYGPAFGLDAREHSIMIEAADGLEMSGRVCAGLQSLPFKTLLEVASPDALQQSAEVLHCYMTTREQDLMAVLPKHPMVKKAVDKTGPLAPAPFGASARLHVLQRTGGQFWSSERALKDYTGSYHISITLPHKPDGGMFLSDDDMDGPDACAYPSASRRLAAAPWTTRLRRRLVGQEPLLDLFTAAHRNFGMMIQWLEPLIIAACGSADPDAVCDANQYTEGSYRTMRTAWGMPGSSDLTTIGTEGISRYVMGGSQWVEDLPFMYYEEGLSGCAEDGMGSDIRTLGEKTPEDDHDMAYPMELGWGLELRFLDSFPVARLRQVLDLVVLVADRSRIYNVVHPVQGNYAWTAGIKQVMIEGWNAILPEEFINGLRINVGLDLSGTSRQAYDVLAAATAELHADHRDGLWTRLFLETAGTPGETSTPPVPHNTNRESWEHAAMAAGFHGGELLTLLFGEGAETVTPGRTYTMGDMRDNLLDHPRAERCSDDVEDLVYLASTLNLLAAEQDAEGRVSSITLHDSDELTAAKASTGCNGPSKDDGSGTGGRDKHKDEDKHSGSESDNANDSDDDDEDTLGTDYGSK